MARVTVQALSAVCGGAQSIHTNAFDEALALPRSGALASRCAPSRSSSTRPAGPTADPLAGSCIVESLTRELEERAWELIGASTSWAAPSPRSSKASSSGRSRSRRLRAAGGGGRARRRRRQPLRRGRADEDELHRLDPEAERRQVERTQRVRTERDAAAVQAGLARVRRPRGARPTCSSRSVGSQRLRDRRRDLRRPAGGARHVRRAPRAVSRTGNRAAPPSGERRGRAGRAMATPDLTAGRGSPSRTTEARARVPRLDRGIDLRHRRPGERRAPRGIGTQVLDALAIVADRLRVKAKRAAGAWRRGPRADRALRVRRAGAARVEAADRADNVASQRVAEKAGFTARASASSLLGSRAGAGTRDVLAAA